MALRHWPLLFLLLVSTLSFAKSESELKVRLTQLEDMIAQNFSPEHRQIQRWVKTRKGGMPKAPPKLLQAYFYIGSLNAQLWMTHPTGNEAQDLGRFRRARSFLEVAALYEYNLDKAEERLDKLEQMRQQRLKEIKHHHWRVGLQFLSYQESAYLKDSAGTETIYSQQRGPALGGQWGYGNLFNEWTIDAWIYRTTGNVGAESTSRYFQRGIGVNGFVVKPAYWKLLSEGKAGVGLGLPVMIRHASFSEPPNASVRSRLSLPFGLSLEGRFAFTPEWLFTTSMAYMDASLLWGFGILYEI